MKFLRFSAVLTLVFGAFFNAAFADIEITLSSPSASNCCVIHNPANSNECWVTCHGTQKLYVDSTTGDGEVYFYGYDSGSQSMVKKVMTRTTNPLKVPDRYFEVSFVANCPTNSDLSFGFDWAKWAFLGYYQGPDGTGDQYVGPGDIIGSANDYLMPAGRDVALSYTDDNHTWYELWTEGYTPVHFPDTSNASCPHYTFIGWFNANGDRVIYNYDEDNDGVDDGYHPASDEILYAHWEPEVYTITLNPNDGGRIVSTIYEKYGEGWATSSDSQSWTSITLAADNHQLPTRSGYTFLGYFDDGVSGNQKGTLNSDGTWTTPGASTATADATWYAHWEENASNCNVNFTFDAGDHGHFTETCGVITFDGNPENVPQKCIPEPNVGEDCRFIGYTYNNVVYYGAGGAPTASAALWKELCEQNRVEFTAQWACDKGCNMVVFEHNHGVFAEQNASDPMIYTKNGYTGFFTDDECTIPYASAPKPATLKLPDSSEAIFKGYDETREWQRIFGDDYTLTNAGSNFTPVVSPVTLKANWECDHAPCPGTDEIDGYAILCGPEAYLDAVLTGPLPRLAQGMSTDPTYSGPGDTEQEFVTRCCVNTKFGCCRDGYSAEGWFFDIAGSTSRPNVVGYQDLFPNGGITFGDTHYWGASNTTTIRPYCVKRIGVNVLCDENSASGDTVTIVIPNTSGVSDQIESVMENNECLRCSNGGVATVTSWGIKEEIPSGLQSATSNGVLPVGFFENDENVEGFAEDLSGLSIYPNFECTEPETMYLACADGAEPISIAATAGDSISQLFSAAFNANCVNYEYCPNNGTFVPTGIRVTSSTGTLPTVLSAAVDGNGMLSPEFFNNNQNLTYDSTWNNVTWTIVGTCQYDAIYECGDHGYTNESGTGGGDDKDDGTDGGSPKSSVSSYSETPASGSAYTVLGFAAANCAADTGYVFNGWKSDYPLPDTIYGQNETSIINSYPSQGVTFTAQYTCDTDYENTGTDENPVCSPKATPGYTATFTCLPNETVLRYIRCIKGLDNNADVTSYYTTLTPEDPLVYNNISIDQTITAPHLTGVCYLNNLTRYEKKWISNNPQPTNWIISSSTYITEDEDFTYEWSYDREFPANYPSGTFNVGFCCRGGVTGTQNNCNPASPDTSFNISACNRVGTNAVKTPTAQQAGCSAPANSTNIAYWEEYTKTSNTSDTTYCWNTYSGYVGGPDGTKLRINPGTTISSTIDLDGTCMPSAHTFVAVWNCEEGYEYNINTGQCDPVYSANYMCYMGDTEHTRTDSFTENSYTVQDLQWYTQNWTEDYCALGNDFSKWFFDGNNTLQSPGDTLSATIVNGRNFYPGYTATFSCEPAGWFTGSTEQYRYVALGGDLSMPNIVGGRTNICGSVSSTYQNWVDLSAGWKYSIGNTLTTPVANAPLGTCNAGYGTVTTGSNFTWYCPTNLTFTPAGAVESSQVEICCPNGTNCETMAVGPDSETNGIYDADDFRLWVHDHCVGSCDEWNEGQWASFGWQVILKDGVTWGDLPQELTNQINVPNPLNTNEMLLPYNFQSNNVGYLFQFIQRLRAIGACQYDVTYNCGTADDGQHTCGSDITDDNSAIQGVTYNIWPQGSGDNAVLCSGCGGYSFAGWKLSLEHITSYSDNTPYWATGQPQFLTWPERDSGTFTAQWTWNNNSANCHKVSFNLNGGNWPTGASTPTLYKRTDETGWYNDNTCSTLVNDPTTPIPTKTNYNFGGFNDGNANVFGPNGHLTTTGQGWTITGPKTLYAQWSQCEENQYYNDGVCTSCATATNGDYPYADPGATSINQCYNDCHEDCTPVDCDGITGVLSCISLNTPIWSGRQYYNVASMCDHSGVEQPDNWPNCGYTITECEPGYTLVGNSCQPIGYTYHVILNPNGGTVGHSTVQNLWEKYNTGWYTNSTFTNPVTTLSGNQLPNAPTNTQFAGYYTESVGGYQQGGVSDSTWILPQPIIQLTQDITWFAHWNCNDNGYIFNPATGDCEPGEVYIPISCGPNSSTTGTLHFTYEQYNAPDFNLYNEMHDWLEHCDGDCENGGSWQNFGWFVEPASGNSLPEIISNNIDSTTGLLTWNFFTTDTTVSAIDLNGVHIAPVGACTYDVVYKCGEGTGADYTESRTARYDMPYMVKGYMDTNCRPQNNNFTFAGWKLAMEHGDYTDNNLHQGDEVITWPKKDKGIFTAQWDWANNPGTCHEVTFDNNTGQWQNTSDGNRKFYKRHNLPGWYNENDCKNASVNTNPSAPIPTKSGSQFTGYKLNANSTDIFGSNGHLTEAGASWTISSDKTLYAQWSQCEANQFYDNGECTSCGEATNNAYPLADPGADSINDCYATCQTNCKTPNPSCPDNQECQYIMTQITGRHYYGTADDDECDISNIEDPWCKINSCPQGWYLNNGNCTQCPSGFTSNLGATSINDCHISCSLPCTLTGCDNLNDPYADPSTCQNIQGSINGEMYCNSSNCNCNSGGCVGVTGCDAPVTACDITYDCQPGYHHNPENNNLCESCNPGDYWDGTNCQSCNEGINLPGNWTSRSPYNWSIDQCYRLCSGDVAGERAITCQDPTLTQYTELFINGGSMPQLQVSFYGNERTGIRVCSQQPKVEYCPVGLMNSNVVTAVKPVVVEVEFYSGLNGSDYRGDLYIAGTRSDGYTATINNAAYGWSQIVGPGQQMPNVGTMNVTYTPITYPVYFAPEATPVPDREFTGYGWPQNGTAQYITGRSLSIANISGILNQHNNSIDATYRLYARYSECASSQFYDADTGTCESCPDPWDDNQSPNSAADCYQNCTTNCDHQGCVTGNGVEQCNYIDATVNGRIYMNNPYAGCTPLGNCDYTVTCDPGYYSADNHTCIPESKYVIILDYNAAANYGSHLVQNANYQEKLYTIHNTGVYLDPARTQEMTTTANPLPVLPQKYAIVTLDANAQDATVQWEGEDTSGRIVNKDFYFDFYGFYDSHFSEQYIAANGRITQRGINTGKGYISNATWSARWHGQTITLPIPERPGYGFTGWYSSSTGGALYDMSFAVQNDITVYAHWTKCDPDQIVINGVCTNCSCTEGNGIEQGTCSAYAVSGNQCNATAECASNYGNLVVNCSGANCTVSCSACDPTANQITINSQCITCNCTSSNSANCGTFSNDNNMCNWSMECLAGYVNLNPNCTGPGNTTCNPTCTPCPAGYISQGNTCVPCESGFYQNADTNTCDPCGVGYTSSSGSTQCYPVESYAVYNCGTGEGNAPYASDGYPMTYNTMHTVLGNNAPNACHRNNSTFACWRFEGAGNQGLYMPGQQILWAYTTNQNFTAVYCANCQTTANGTNELSVTEQCGCECTLTCNTGYHVDSSTHTCEPNVEGITYQPNGGTPNMSYTQTVTYDATFDTKGAVYTKYRNVLDWWHVVSGGEGTFENGRAELSQSYVYRTDGSTTLEAHWTECAPGWIPLDNVCHECEENTYQNGDECKPCGAGYTSAAGSTECEAIESDAVYDCNCSHVDGVTGTPPAAQSMAYGATHTVKANSGDGAHPGCEKADSAFMGWLFNNDIYNAGDSVLWNYTTYQTFCAQYCPECPAIDNGTNQFSFESGQCHCTQVCDYGYYADAGICKPIKNLKLIYRPNGGRPNQEYQRTIENFNDAFTTLGAVYTKNDEIMTRWDVVGGSTNTFTTGQAELGRDYAHYLDATDTTLDAHWEACQCNYGVNDGVASCVMSNNNNICDYDIECKLGYINPTAYECDSPGNVHCKAKCDKCPDGSISVNGECKQCEIGTYQDGNTCVDCPEGYTTAYPGSTSVDDCNVPRKYQLHYQSEYGQNMTYNQEVTYNAAFTTAKASDAGFAYDNHIITLWDVVGRPTNTFATGYAEVGADYRAYRDAADTTLKARWEACQCLFGENDGVASCSTPISNNSCGYDIICKPGYINPQTESCSGVGNLHCNAKCDPCPAGTYQAGDHCEPCDPCMTSLPGAASINECYLTCCPTGQHIEHGDCVDNEKTCSAPDATDAVRVWNDTLKAYGACIVRECRDGYHILDNACVVDDETCTVANGHGERDWNSITNQWGTCFVTTCDPGYEVNATGTGCDECSNRRVNGEVAVSGYIYGCEIATCMYQGQKYALERNECVPICSADRYDPDDQSGTITWDERTKKCIRTCNPGYKMW